MSNRDPAFMGHCACGRPCYGQSTCNTCDKAGVEEEEEEEKFYCPVCDDVEVVEKDTYCQTCREEAEAQLDDSIREMYGDDVDFFI